MREESSPSSDTSLRLSRREIDELADQIAETAAHIDAATHHLLSLIRTFDLAAGWHAQGALSCARWLNWRIGIGLGAAREHVRVARALADLPRIDKALSQGEISYSKARAMTRVATPENEETLLQMARCMTASQLEQTCRLYRQAAANFYRKDPLAALAEDARRYVRLRESPQDDRLIRIEIQLHTEEAAAVMKAIEVSAQGSDRVSGLMALAEDALAGNTQSSGRKPVEVTVHVDADTFSGHTEDGRGVPAETAKRLCCDAGIVPVLESKAGEVLDVGRKTRSIPAAILQRFGGRW